MSKFDIVVRQSNDFVESCFAQEYSVQELKTMEFIISQTVKADIELAKDGRIKEIELPAQSFAKMIGANIYQIYRDAQHLSHALMNKKINLKYIGKNGKPAFEMHTFLTSMRYEDGSVKLGVNPFVLPYFLEIKERFTEYNLRHIIAMGSSYAIKLYKLLRQYLPIGKREIEIIDLRNQFGIDEKKYKFYADFKRYVIDRAKKHINSYTDIQIEYTEIKCSRKVTAFIFFIKEKLSQEKQAKIAFEYWVEKSQNTALKSQIVDAKKAKKDIYLFTFVKESFEKWLDKYIFNYDPSSHEPLQYHEAGTLFYSEENQQQA